MDDFYHGRPADIWACGVTLFACLFGVMPFNSEDPSTLREQIMNDDIKLPLSDRMRVSRQAQMITRKRRV